MKIKWMIQDVNMRESQLKRKFDALQSLREEMHPIGVMKHYDYITGLSEAIRGDWRRYRVRVRFLIRR